MEQVDVNAPPASGEVQPAVTTPLKIFISYRHADTGGWAMLLQRELAMRFGEENVFLDIVTLQPGKRWLQEIRQHASGCAAFIALIGPGWEASIGERGGPGSESDYVRAEIEEALRRGRNVEVIAALVDHAPPPRVERLPPTLRPLLARHRFEELRASDWNADVEKLVTRLQSVALEQTEGDNGGDGREENAPEEEPTAPRPSARHYDEVVKLLLDDGSPLVFFIGPGVNSSDRDEPWADPECSYTPDADELAAYLARKISLKPEPNGLARVAQFVLETEGEGLLYRTLRQTLTQQCPAGSVHQFLAALPAQFREHRGCERYQLIVTTNYDDTLERSFEEAGEPFDLAVYMASGPDKGKFVHLPQEGEPQRVDTNSYRKFPITQWGALERAVIVKIHGAADGAWGAYEWQNNYVITEDDYIDYLAQGQVVPVQILQKLRDGNLLFLGYSMRDWNLRVFLQRIFGQHLPNKSWAVQRSPDELDRGFWTNTGRVDRFALPLREYVASLGARVAARAPAAT